MPSTTDNPFHATARSLDELSFGRHRLVAYMQDNPYCRIENIPIRNREPVLDPVPRIVREIKFGTEDRVHPSRDKRDFLLKQQHLELFALFDRMGAGTVVTLEVKAGLPFRIFLVTTA